MSQPATLDEFLLLVNSVKTVFKGKISKFNLDELSSIMMSGYRLGFIAGIDASLDSIKTVSDGMSRDIARVQIMLDSGSGEEDSDLLVQLLDAVEEFKQRLGEELEKIPFTKEEMQ